jgi:hypothetical protein
LQHVRQVPGNEFPIDLIFGKEIVDIIINLIRGRLTALQHGQAGTKKVTIFLAIKDFRLYGEI